MTLNDYQEKAMTTCMDSSNNFSYMMLNLVGEVGELASKVAKLIRKEKVVINDNELQTCGASFTPAQIRKMSKAELEAFATDQAYDAIINMQMNDVELKLEAGEILKQFAGFCSVMGWKLEDVSQLSLIDKPETLTKINKNESKIQETRA